MDYEDTLHDLRVKYDNTVVGLVLPSGIRLPFFIEEIFVKEEDIDDEDMDPDEGENVPASYTTFHGRVYNVGQSAWHMDARLDDLDFNVPKLGVYEVQDSAIYGSRLASLSSPQKYRKTLTFESLSFLDPSLLEKKNLGGYKISTGDILPEYFHAAINEQPYRSIENAVEQLLEGNRLGCALSEQYSIHIDRSLEDFKIAREGYVVAYYFVEDKTVRLLNEDLKPLFEELSELGFLVAVDEYVEGAEVEGAEVKYESIHKPVVNPFESLFVFDESTDISDEEWVSFSLEDM